MNEYEWVTDEMFRNKLEDIMTRETAGGLLMIPGAYEVFVEHFNNQVLEELEAEREEELE